MNELIAGRLGLQPQDLQIVADLLAEHVPDRPVWAFGSRASGRARRYSDLDLAIGGREKLPVGLRYDLLDALDASILPIEVDVVDLNDVDDWFRRRIEPNFLTIQDCSGDPAELDL